MTQHHVTCLPADDGRCGERHQDTEARLGATLSQSWVVSGSGPNIDAVMAGLHTTLCHEGSRSW